MQTVANKVMETYTIPITIIREEQNHADGWEQVMKASTIPYTAHYFKVERMWYWKADR